MGKKILNHFDVLRRHSHQVAGATPCQIGWRQGIKLTKQINTHLGQHAERHVVCDPRFQPVKNAGNGGECGEGKKVQKVGLAHLDGGNSQCSGNADADEGHHPGYAAK